MLTLVSICGYICEVIIVGYETILCNFRPYLQLVNTSRTAVMTNVCAIQRLFDLTRVAYDLRDVFLSAAAATLGCGAPSRDLTIPI